MMAISASNEGSDIQSFPCQDPDGSDIDEPAAVLFDSHGHGVIVSRVWSQIHTPKIAAAK